MAGRWVFVGHCRYYATMERWNNPTWKNIAVEGSSVLTGEHGPALGTAMRAYGAKRYWCRSSRRPQHMSGYRKEWKGTCSKRLAVRLVEGPHSRRSSVDCMCSKVVPRAYGRSILRPSIASHAGRAGCLIQVSHKRLMICGGNVITYHVCSLSRRTSLQALVGAHRYSRRAPESAAHAKRSRAVDVVSDPPR